MISEHTMNTRRERIAGANAAKLQRQVKAVADMLGDQYGIGYSPRGRTDLEVAIRRAIVDQEWRR